MSAIDTREDWSKREISATPLWTAMRGWTVANCATEADCVAEMARNGVYVNSLHPANNNLFCEGPCCKSEGVQFWRVTAKYSYGSKLDASSPLLAPPVFAWEFGEITEALDQDIYGNQIKNTAGNPFNGTLCEDYTSVFFTVTKNLPVFTIQAFLSYYGKINSDLFSPIGMFSLEPGQCRCKSIFPAKSYTAKDLYVPVVWRFEARGGRKIDGDGLWDGFKRRIRDQGSMGWFANGGSTKPGVFYDNGKPTPSRVTQDIALDGTGKPLVSGYTCGDRATAGGAAPISNPASAAGVNGIYPGGGVYLDSTANGTWIKFMTKYTASFKGIGLPQTAI